MPVFVIEHLEPDVFEWCKLEYAHISSVVGKENLLFTKTTNDVLAKLGRVDERPVASIPLIGACVLDPESDVQLTPQIAKQFDYFIFGGILGDNPPRARTKEELLLPYPRFNLGKEQMSTDTAVIVTKMIVDGLPVEQMQFQDGIEIEIAQGESVDLPYKYLLIDGKPMLPDGLVEMLKSQDSF